MTKHRLLFIGLTLFLIFGIGIYLRGHNSNKNTANLLGEVSQSPIQLKDCSFETSETPSRVSVIFNEVAWMGDKVSANNEWIELKNISSHSISLNGWSLKNQKGKIKVVLGNTQVPPGGFYLLERGSSNFLSDIKADTFYSGALNNSGDNLRLFDNDCHLIDEITASSKWPAGDNTTKKTMERSTSTSSWYTSAIVGGTPKSENSHPTTKASPTPKLPTTTIKPSVHNTLTPTPKPSEVTCNTWCTSSYYSSKYYYCANDSAWRSLSPNYLKSFATKEELLAKYPSRIIHDASLCK